MLGCYDSSRVFGNVLFENLLQHLLVGEEQVLHAWTPELALSEPSPLLEGACMLLRSGHSKLDGLHEVKLRILNARYLQ